MYSKIDFSSFTRGICASVVFISINRSSEPFFLQKIFDYYNTSIINIIIIVLLYISVVSYVSPVISAVKFQLLGCSRELQILKLLFSKTSNL